MKMIKIFTTAVLVLTVSGALANAELAQGTWGSLSLDVESVMYSNLINGATGFSVLREGNYSVHNMKFGFEKDLGGLKLESGLAARITDDTLVDNNRFEVRRWYMGLGAMGMPVEYSLKLGDVYGELSNYTFSQSLFGLSGYLQFKDFMFKPIYGRQNEAKENLNYRRDSYGFRAEQVLFDKVSVGFNYVDTKDDEGSVDNDSNISQLEENSVYSIDMRTMISRNLVISGNYAQSDYEEKKSSVTEKGTAYNIRTVYRAGALMASGEYEVTGSSFNSISGYTTKDREVMSGSVRYRFLKRIDMILSYENMSNNLNGALPYKTTISIPALRSDIMLGRGLNMNLGYKQRVSESDDTAATVDRKALTYMLGMDYRYAGTNFALDTRMTENTDKKNTDNEYDNIYYRISGRGNYRLKDKDIKILPVLIYSLSQDDLNAGKKDKSASITAGTGVVLSRSWELDVKNILNQVERSSTGKDTARNTIRVGILYRFSGEAERTLEANYSFVDHDPDGSAEDYSETVLEFSANLKF